MKFCECSYAHVRDASASLRVLDNCEREEEREGPSVQLTIWRVREREDRGGEKELERERGRVERGESVRGHGRGPWTAGASLSLFPGAVVHDPTSEYKSRPALRCGAETGEIESERVQHPGTYAACCGAVTRSMPKIMRPFMMAGA